MRILTFEKRKKVDARWEKAPWESPGLTLEIECVRLWVTRWGDSVPGSWVVC